MIEPLNPNTDNFLETGNTLEHSEGSYSLSDMVDELWKEILNSNILLPSKNTPKKKVAIYTQGNKNIDFFNRIVREIDKDIPWNEETSWEKKEWRRDALIYSSSENEKISEVLSKYLGVNSDDLDVSVIIKENEKKIKEYFLAFHWEEKLKRDGNDSHKDNGDRYPYADVYLIITNDKNEGLMLRYLIKCHILKEKLSMLKNHEAEKIYASYIPYQSSDDNLSLIFSEYLGKKRLGLGSYEEDKKYEESIFSIIFQNAEKNFDFTNETQQRVLKGMNSTQYVCINFYEFPPYIDVSSKMPIQKEFNLKCYLQDYLKPFVLEIASVLGDKITESFIDWVKQQQIQTRIKYC